MPDFEIVMLVNRTNAPYEGMFDGKVVTLKANETKPMAANVARNLVAQSYQSIGLTTGVPAAYRLGVQGENDCTPIGKREVRAEILDRSSMERLQHSKPQILTQSGVQAIPPADRGSSPVSTPVSAAIAREASTKKSHKKKQPTLRAQTLEFDNPQPRHGGGFGAPTVVSVNR